MPKIFSYYEFSWDQMFMFYFILGLFHRFLDNAICVRETFLFWLISLQNRCQLVSNGVI